MHIVVNVAVPSISQAWCYTRRCCPTGVGVDPSTNSFCTMINGARNEMSRDPVVWWNLMTAFGFMVTLVLPMTLFSSAVREALRSARAQAWACGAYFATGYMPFHATALHLCRREGLSTMLTVDQLSTEIDADAGVVRAVDDLSFFFLRPGETFALVVSPAAVSP